MACGSEPGPLPIAVLRVGETDVVVELARSPVDRHRGLSERPSLPAGHGMLFVYEEAGRPEFTMRDMAFELDLIWIREGHVVGITPSVTTTPVYRGQTYRAPEAVDSVLEVASGTARAQGWELGTPARLLGDVPLHANR